MVPCSPSGTEEHVLTKLSVLVTVDLGQRKHDRASLSLSSTQLLPRLVPHSSVPSSRACPQSPTSGFKVLLGFGKLKYWHYLRCNFTPSS